MSTEKEATVRFRVEGDDEISRAAGKIQNSWQSAGTAIAGSFKTVGSVVGSAVQGVLSDLSHVVTAAGAINFAGSVAQVQRFEESVARLGVGAGRSIASVQQGMNQLGRAIGEMPDATAGWVSAVGQLTYSYEGAAQAAKGMAEYAALTGQSLSQVQGLAVALSQSGVAAGDTSAAIGQMVAQAKALGTVGGPKALGDMFQAMEGQISQLAGGQGSKLTALMAGFGGKEGFTPQQRQRALSGVMSKIEADPEGFERFLGHSITDQYGHVKDIGGVMKELSAYGKKGKYEHMRGRFTFGAEGEAALEHTDWAAVAAAENANPATDAEHALARYKDTPAGRRADQEIRKNMAMQETVGSGSMLGRAREWLGEVGADHPLATGFGLMVGGALANKGMGAAMSWLGGGSGGAAGAGTAGAGAAIAEGAGGSLLTGGGAVGMGAFGLLGASVLATGKTLMELGKASKMRQGFMNKDLSAGEAAALSGRASAAEAASPGERSEGMNAAMEAEMALKRRQQAQRASAQGGPAGAVAADPQQAKLIAEMQRQGATLELIRQTLDANAKRPVMVTVEDRTMAGVDARARGEQ